MKKFLTRFQEWRRLYAEERAEKRRLREEVRQCANGGGYCYKCRANPEMRKTRS